MLLAACGAPLERPETGLGPRVLQDAFLVAPTTGYLESLGNEQAEALDAAYRRLMRGDDPESVLAVSSTLDEGASGPPAVVLAAQARYVQGRCTLGLDRLSEVAELHPGFLAANLILGRCREVLGDLPGASDAYERASADSPAALERLADLGPRARDAAVARILVWLEGGLQEQAREGIEALQRWAPRDSETLLALRELAERAGDRRLELETVRSLTANGGESDLLARRAELELEVGNAGSGLRILEDLVSKHPDDAALAQGLERARFAWRVSMLPGPARALAASPRLDRGELATLLYWVFPSVRYGRAPEAIIANDILDHEHRAEIVRIVNLGIMDTDPNLHAFKPDSEAQRLDALRGLLRVLAQNGPPAGCLDGTTIDSRTSIESICRIGARCGLLNETADCLPQAALSGSSAMEMARSTAERLELR